MKTSTRRRQRLLRRIALGLAVAAIVAPSAQAIDPKVAPDTSDAVVFPTSDERDAWRAVGEAMVETLPAEVLAAGNSGSVVFPTSEERDAWRAIGQDLAKTLTVGGQGIDIDSVVFPTTEERDAAREAAQALVDDVAAPTSATTTTEAFDFTDAVIGGAVVLGAMLIAFAAALLVRSRHRLAGLHQ